MFLKGIVVQSPSHVQLFVPSGTMAHQASLSLTISRSLPKFLSIALVIPSSHLILWCPLFLLPSIFPSIRDFSNELAVCIKWPKYWSFSFSISPSNEYWGLISLWEWLVWSHCSPSDSLESSSATHFKSINSSALSFLYSPALTYIITGKTIALTRRTFASKVVSLLFNTLSRFVIAFLLRSEHLLKFHGCSHLPKWF